MIDGRSFAILGGYGRLGRLVAVLLIRGGAQKVTIAGRDADKARDAARELAPYQGAGQVASERIGADDVVGLAAPLDGRQPARILPNGCRACSETNVLELGIGFGGWGFKSREAIKAQHPTQPMDGDHAFNDGEADCFLGARCPRHGSQSGRSKS